MTGRETTHTETTHVRPPEPGLSMTVPSDTTPAGTHAVVLHTPVAAGPGAEPIATQLPPAGSAVTPAMTDPPSPPHVTVTSRENP